MLALLGLLAACTAPPSFEPVRANDPDIGDLMGISSVASTEPAEALEGDVEEVKSPARVDGSAVTMFNGFQLIGSGVVVDLRGKTYVLTARHVAEHMSDLPIACPGEGDCKMMGSIVAQGVGPSDDWSLFEAPEGMGPTAQVDDHPLHLGDEVMIVGAPRGIPGIHSWGRIGKLGGEHFIVDAFAYFGSSGGPVYDEKGKVIGIVVAIPTDFDKGTLEDLAVCLWVGSMTLVP